MDCYLFFFWSQELDLGINGLQGTGEWHLPSGCGTALTRCMKGHAISHAISRAMLGVARALPELGHGVQPGRQASPPPHCPSPRCSARRVEAALHAALAVPGVSQGSCVAHRPALELEGTEDPQPACCCPGKAPPPNRGTVLHMPPLTLPVLRCRPAVAITSPRCRRPGRCPPGCRACGW